MESKSLRFLAVGLVMAAIAPVDGTAQTHQSAVQDFRVVTVAEGLVSPWAMAFLPGGDMLVTEKPGRLRIIRDGNLLPTPVPGLPEVFARGQGGLLDVAVHPDFASNRMIYITYSKPQAEEGQSTTALIRARLENDRLTDVEELFEAESRGRGHYGSRIAFDGNGHVFVSVGDRQASPSGDLENHPAQDRSNNHGTINRLNEDGSIPSDNPFVGQSGIRPEIWSYGHRNPQGLAMHPETGELWSTEHGPQGGDELNHVQPGLNYGWPVIGYGVNYGAGNPIHESQRRDGMEQPAHFWVPSIATSSLMIYTGDMFPEWRGDFFVGGLAGQHLARVSIDGDRVSGEETLLRGIGRVRDVRQSPDGYIYIAIESRAGDPTPIVRLEPAGM